MNKNRSLSAAFIAIVFVCMFSSCAKLANSIFKNLTFSTPAQSFSIPPVSPAVALASGFMPAITGSFNYNLDSFIKASTGGALSIKNLSIIKINSCIFTVTNPKPTSNFQDFQNFEISFSTYKLSVNQPDVYSTTMTLLPNDTAANMLPNLQGSSFNYSIDGAMRYGTTDTMNCNVVFTFSLNVQG